MGIKEISGIYMRVEIHIALRARCIDSGHGGVRHAEWIHEAVVSEGVHFFLGNKRCRVALRSQET